MGLPAASVKIDLHQSNAACAELCGFAWRRLRWLPKKTAWGNRAHILQSTSHVFTTVVCRKVNSAILVALLAGFCPPPSVDAHMSIRLNGNWLSSKLIDVYSGFFIQILLHSEAAIIEEMIEALPLIAPTLHVPFPLIGVNDRHYVVFLPGGRTLQSCRKYEIREHLEDFEYYLSMDLRGRLDVEHTCRSFFW